MSISRSGLYISRMFVRYSILLVKFVSQTWACDAVLFCKFINKEYHWRETLDSYAIVKKRNFSIIILKARKDAR